MDLTGLWGDEDALRQLLLETAPDRRTELAGQLVEDHAGWLAVRSLVRAGELEPLRTNEYFLGWHVWFYKDRGAPLADRLRAEPESLTEIWELLEIQGGEFSSFASCDRGRREEGKWSTALATLVEQGLLDRQRLLDLTLEILSRDFAPYQAQWYATMHEALKPTLDERAAAQHRYARLCAGDSPRVVAFAVKALMAVSKAGTLDDAFAVRYLPAAAAADAAGTAKLAMQLAGRIADGRPDLAEPASDVFRSALSHPSSEVRRIAGARLDVPPATPFVASAVEYPEPEPRPWFERRMLRVPLEIPDTPAALAEAYASLLTDSSQADLFLAVLDGTQRMARRELPGVFTPLVRRATKIAKTYPDAVHKLVTTLILGLAGREVPRPPVVEGWLRPLHHRVGTLLDGTAVPISAATHAGGWLDPVVFVSRLLDHPEAAPDDVVDGLLRLAPDTRADALTLASGLTGPYADAVKFALGGSTVPGTDWVGLAAARARQPESADPLGVLAGAGGPPIVWSVTIDRSVTHYEAMSYEAVPQVTVPHQPWLGLLPDHPYVTEWEGFTTLHESLAAPYDFAFIEARVVDHLFTFDFEATYPTEQAALPPYLDRPQVPGRTGVLVIATALSVKRPGAVALGLEVARTLLDARLLGPRALGEALAVLGASLVPTRLAKRLAILAEAHPVAVLSTLDALLPMLNQSQRGIHALLELAADLQDSGAGVVSVPTTRWLAAFTGTTKAAQAASRLVG